jgi:hypothetical protein
VKPNGTVNSVAAANSVVLTHLGRALLLPLLAAGAAAAAAAFAAAAAAMTAGGWWYASKNIIIQVISSVRTCSVFKYMHTTAQQHTQTYTYITVCSAGGRKWVFVFALAVVRCGVFYCKVSSQFVPLSASECHASEAQLHMLLQRTSLHATQCDIHAVYVVKNSMIYTHLLCKYVRIAPDCVCKSVCACVSAYASVCVCVFLIVRQCIPHTAATA